MTSFAVAYKKVPKLPWITWSGAYSNFLFKSNLSKAASLVSVLGYLILFNDTILGSLNFVYLQGDDDPIGLKPDVRLRLVYFGLVIIGLCAIVFSIFAPKEIHRGMYAEDYVNFGIENFGWGDFASIRSTLCRYEKDVIPEKSDEQIYWQQRFLVFSDSANGHRDFLDDGDWSKADYSTAINKHRSFLIEMLSTHYEIQQYKWHNLIVSLTIASSIGHVCVFLPAIDTFIAVLIATIR